MEGPPFAAEQVGWVCTPVGAATNPLPLAGLASLNYQPVAVVAAPAGFKSPIRLIPPKLA